MKAEGIPASVSNTAGTYVCNHIMYGVLYHIHKSFPGMRGGFMHVPFTTEQVLNRPNTPSLSSEQIARGIEIAVQAIIDHPDDIFAVGGAEHWVENS